VRRTILHNPPLLLDWGIPRHQNTMTHVNGVIVVGDYDPTNYDWK